MKKYFVFTDIHGFFDELQAALKKAGFDKDNPDHIIISCGDLLDRGSKPRECLQFVNSLYAQGRAILIKGNHETLLEEMLQRGEPFSHDYSNGTVRTLVEMFPTCEQTIDVVWEAMKNDADYLEYKSHLVNFYETDNYIFTHGFIPLNWTDPHNPDYKTNWRDNELDWDSYPTGARWLNGIKYAHRGLNRTSKTVVVGHYHCSYGHARFDNPEEYEEFPAQKAAAALEKCFSPYYEPGLVALDACTAYSKKVNILVLDVL